MARWGGSTGDDAKQVFAVTQSMYSGTNVFVSAKPCDFFPSAMVQVCAGDAVTTLPAHLHATQERLQEKPTPLATTQGGAKNSCKDYEAEVSAQVFLSLRDPSPAFARLLGEL